MADREKWLALTAEEAIEPELLICDPHHHIWDHPGSRYLIDEFSADICGGHRVDKTVFVECRQFYRSYGPEAFRPVGETEFIDRVAGPVNTRYGVTDVAAGPLGIGPYAENREGVFACWKDSMVGLARCANVYVKLGGRCLTMAGFGWHKREAPPGSTELAEAIGPYYRTCIEYFGPERCMFESNFPVDRASCSYTVLWNAFKRLTGDYSASERTALFHDTASRVYRLQDS